MAHEDECSRRLPKFADVVDLCKAQVSTSFIEKIYFIAPPRVNTPRQTPPGRPLGRHTPLDRHSPGQTALLPKWPLQWAVRILLECILVLWFFSHSRSLSLDVIEPLVLSQGSLEFCDHWSFLPFITVRKQSLMQGNIFRRVCQSFCSWGPLYDVTSCLAAWSHVPSRGGLPDRDPPGQRPLLEQRPPSCMAKSGWYATFWNAFLSNHVLCPFSC